MPNSSDRIIFNFSTAVLLAQQALACYTAVAWLDFKRSATAMRTQFINYKYITKNWALAMMLKALLLVHFWSVLLLKEQMMTSVRKTLKTLVWSAQNHSISSKIFPENNDKIGHFLPITFWWSLPRKFPWNQPIFPWICP